MVWANAAAAKKPAHVGPTPFNLLETEHFPMLGAPSTSCRAGSDAGTPAAPTKQREAPAPAGTAPDIVGANETLLSAQAPAFYVTGSKKGGFPITIEKRACGKKVTVVRNIVGDAAALLSGLKKKMGCGGVVHADGSVEVQGERQPAVERYLTEQRCLKSVSAAKKVAAVPTKVAAAVAAPTAIDKRRAAAHHRSGPAAAEIASISEQAAKRMKPAEIKAHLKAAGLSNQGNKKELLARLLEQIRLCN